MKRILFLTATLFSMFATSQIITFNDVNFKVKLTSQFGSYCRDAEGNNVVLDANSDGEIDTTEALMCYQLVIENGNINDVTGIEYFTNLKTVKMKFNSIDTFNASTLVNLEYLDLYLNGLQSLTLGGLPHLSYLDCSSNQLTVLDVNGCPELVTLKCGNNNINGLVIADLPQLVTLQASGYSQTLNTLTLSNLPALETVNCDVSRLTDLFLSDVSNIKTFSCKQNSFTSLDFSMLTNVETIYAVNNYTLDYLNVKNGRNEYVTFGVNVGQEALTYICADAEQISDIEYGMVINGMTASCGTSPYCSFTPGGNYYTIVGMQRWDIDNNGCSDTDPLFDNFRIHTTKANDDTNTSFDIFSSNTGDYQLNLPEGTYTTSPLITDNENFFTVTPASATITLPAIENPIMQNFCVSPNGNQNDVEIKILPIGDARPGFDSKYKIIFENKGNQVASGMVSFTFNDAVLDLINTIPVATSVSANVLEWNYVNLFPFERRVIELTFNVNSPAEIPTVNIGDVLYYQASITSSNTDVNLSNNSSTLYQTVVGSYDPNDMVCLDGSIIGVNQVGKYVYYRVRFENTGTFPAEFVVVKNLIDSNSFDISTLTPIAASHPFRTEMRYTDFDQTVEFIFENINLPFDDANNDGYVIYKIKTKNNLGLGSSFSNNAKIYFDYNLPINTNTYTTTVTALGNNNFEADTVHVWPNPADSVLNVSVKSEVTVKIYSILGQLIAEQNINNGLVDISSLISGIYVMDIVSETGNSKIKFIKK